MEVIDPGHVYKLAHLDGSGCSPLIFVKREGQKFPGNVGRHEGTTIQEVLRAVSERLGYVNMQQPCAETEAAKGLVETTILLLELHAARTHARFLTLDNVSAVVAPEQVGADGHVR